MSAPHDIVAYTFAADIYCPEHVIDALITHGLASPGAWDMDTERALDQIADANAIERYDERTFDSGDFPKVVFRDQCDDTEHCGYGHAIEC